MSDSTSPRLSPLPVEEEPNGSNQATNDLQDLPVPGIDIDDLSDNDSVLSDVDEAQFEDFDPANVVAKVNIIAVDEDNVKLLGRHKRKRDGDDTVVGKKKKKEGRREKSKKPRKTRDDDENFSGGEAMEGKRPRKKKAFDEGAQKKERPKMRAASPENEETLTPEERRRRALDRAMDAALKNPNKRRRRQDGIDVSSAIDEEIASLRQRMADAAEQDVQARSADPPRPAMHKLRLLPEVSSLLNRNGREVENAIVDPENNLLESVRFFLEPLNDGSLPAYNIQRELFASLGKLPIGKEALVSSGIGKVVLFYTKTKKAEANIKRQAERLMGEWTRPILKRSDDYRKRVLEEREYDPAALAIRPGSVLTSSQLPALETVEQRRARALAPPIKNPNRARLDVSAKSYSIVPKRSAATNVATTIGKYGGNVDDAFRKIKARQALAAGKGPKR